MAWVKRLIRPGHVPADVTFAPGGALPGLEVSAVEVEMTDESNNNDVSPGVLAAAMLIGALTGFALWMVTDTFVFLPVFIGAGLAVGLALRVRDEGEDS